MSSVEPRCVSREAVERSPRVACLRIWTALLALGALLAVLGSVSPSAAQAGVTHEYLRRLENLEPVNAVAVGPVGGEGVAVEKGAVFVAAGRGVLERFSAAGAPLPFECEKEPACAGYVEGNRLTGTTAGGFGKVRSVAVDDATGEAVRLDRLSG